MRAALVVLFLLALTTFYFAQTGTCPTCSALDNSPQAQITVVVDDKTQSLDATLYYLDLTHGTRPLIGNAVLLMEVFPGKQIPQLYVLTTDAAGKAVYDFHSIYVSGGQAMNGQCTNFKIIYCPFCVPVTPTSTCGFSACLDYAQISDQMNQYSNSPLGGAGTINSIDDIPYAPPSAFPATPNPNTYLPQAQIASYCPPPQAQNSTPAFCLPLIIIFSLLSGALYVTGRNPFAGFNMGGARIGRHMRYMARGRGVSVSTQAIAAAAQSVAGAAKTMKGGKDATINAAAKKAGMKDASGKDIDVSKMSKSQKADVLNSLRTSKALTSDDKKALSDKALNSAGWAALRQQEKGAAGARTFGLGTVHTVKAGLSAYQGSGGILAAMGLRKAAAGSALEQAQKEKGAPLTFKERMNVLNAHVEARRGGAASAGPTAEQVATGKGAAFAPVFAGVVRASEIYHESTKGGVAGYFGTLLGTLGNVAKFLILTSQPVQFIEAFRYAFTPQSQYKSFVEMALVDHKKRFENDFQALALMIVGKGTIVTVGGQQMEVKDYSPGANGKIVISLAAVAGKGAEQMAGGKVVLVLDSNKKLESVSFFAEGFAAKTPDNKTGAGTVTIRIAGTEKVLEDTAVKKKADLEVQKGKLEEQKGALSGKLAELKDQLKTAATSEEKKELRAQIKEASGQLEKTTTQLEKLDSQLAKIPTVERNILVATVQGVDGSLTTINQPRAESASVKAQIKDLNAQLEGASPDQKKDLQAQIDKLHSPAAAWNSVMSLVSPTLGSLNLGGDASKLESGCATKAAAMSEILASARQESKSAGIDAEKKLADLLPKATQTLLLGAYTNQNVAGALSLIYASKDDKATLEESKGLKTSQFSSPDKFATGTANIAGVSELKGFKKEDIAAFKAAVSDFVKLNTLTNLAVLSGTPLSVKDAAAASGTNNDALKSAIVTDLAKTFENQGMRPQEAMDHAKGIMTDDRVKAVRDNLQAGVQETIKAPLVAIANITQQTGVGTPAPVVEQIVKKAGLDPTKESTKELIVLMADKISKSSIIDLSKPETYSDFSKASLAERVSQGRVDNPEDVAKKIVRGMTLPEGQEKVVTNALIAYLSSTTLGGAAQSVGLKDALHGVTDDKTAGRILTSVTKTAEKEITVQATAVYKIADAIPATFTKAATAATDLFKAQGFSTDAIDHIKAATTSQLGATASVRNDVDLKNPDQRNAALADLMIKNPSIATTPEMKTLAAERVQGLAVQEYLANAGNSLSSSSFSMDGASHMLSMAQKADSDGFTATIARLVAGDQAWKSQDRPDERTGKTISERLVDAAFDQAQAKYYQMQLGAAPSQVKEEPFSLLSPVNAKDVAAEQEARTKVAAAIESRDAGTAVRVCEERINHYRDANDREAVAAWENVALHLHADATNPDVTILQVPHEALPAAKQDETLQIFGYNLIHAQLEQQFSLADSGKPKEQRYSQQEALMAAEFKARTDVSGKLQSEHADFGGAMSICADQVRYYQNLGDETSAKAWTSALQEVDDMRKGAIPWTPATSGASILDHLDANAGTPSEVASTNQNYYQAKMDSAGHNFSEANAQLSFKLSAIGQAAEAALGEPGIPPLAKPAQRGGGGGEEPPKPPPETPPAKPEQPPLAGGASEPAPSKPSETPPPLTEAEEKAKKQKEIIDAYNAKRKKGQGTG